MTNRYDAVEIVRPWIFKWQAPFKARAVESGKQGGGAYEDHETWYVRFGSTFSS